MLHDSRAQVDQYELNSNHQQRLEEIMKKMSINQDLNKRQFEKYQTDLTKPQEVESQQEDLPIEAPTH
jgi:hypothetical protein